MALEYLESHEFDDEVKDTICYLKDLYYDFDVMYEDYMKLTNEYIKNLYLIYKNENKSMNDFNREKKVIYKHAFNHFSIILLTTAFKDMNEKNEKLMSLYNRKRLKMKNTK